MVRAAKKSGKHHISALPQGATHEVCGWGGVAISGNWGVEMKGMFEDIPRFFAP